MTSVSGGFNQVPANSLYINLVAVQSSIVDSNNNPVPWVVAYGALSTAGTVLFRDMGRTNVLPNPTTATSVGGQSTLLRKVQLVTVGSAGGYFGTATRLLQARARARTSTQATSAWAASHSAAAAASLLDLPASTKHIVDTI